MDIIWTEIGEDGKPVVDNKLYEKSLPQKSQEQQRIISIVAGGQGSVRREGSL